MTKLVKILSILLCIGCLFTTTAAFACESAIFDARPNSQKFEAQVGGLYQYGQFMGSEEIEDCLKALDDTEVIEYIYDGLIRREEEIYLDMFDEYLYPDDLENYFRAILNNYPELYFVSMTYQYYIYDDGTLASLVPIYTLDEAEMVQTQAIIDEEVAKACSVIEEGMSDFDKLLAVHDYFADNYSYDYKNLRDLSYMRKHSIVGLFVDKTAVCQGYALGYKYILDKLGIENQPVQSEAMAHLWNLVQLENGNWYHVDTTWDDPSQDWYNPAYTPTMSDEEYAIRIGDCREYFMLSDNAIQSKESPHFAYTPDGLAKDDIYAEIGMADVNTTLVWYGGSWYYFDSDCYMHKYNPTTGTDEKLHRIEKRWPYLSSFAYMYEYNGKIYYNSADSIMVYDPSTGTESVYMTDFSGVGTNMVYIYKMELVNSRVVLTLAEDYTGKSSVQQSVTLSNLTDAPTTPEPTDDPGADVAIANVITDTNNTTVTLSGAISGIVCAVQSEGGRLVSVQMKEAAEALTFEGIAADEIYLWESISTMKPICETYVVN